MGYSVTAGLIIGMEIKKDEWFIEEHGEKRCKKGHVFPDDNEAAFCPKDGTPIEAEVTYKLNPKFELPSAVKYEDFEETTLVKGAASLCVYAGDPLQNCESDSSILVLGKRVFEAYGNDSSRSKKAQPVDLATVEVIKKQIEDFVRAHYLPARSVRLYPYLYESY